MLTKNDFCDYETCVALKKLGYKNGSLAYYTSEKVFHWRCAYIYGVAIPDLAKSSNKEQYKHVVDAPNLHEAQKWLREEKEVYVTVIPEYNEFVPIKGVKYRLEVAHWKDDEFGYETIEWLDEECSHTIITFDSYEEALLEGIKEAVKILKENETIHR